MKSNTDQQPSEQTGPSSDCDIVWGAEAIGEVIDRTPGQIYYLLRIGALRGAVVKLSHKQLFGSRKRLRDLVALAEGP